MDHEYAFDVKLFAVIRIRSSNKALAIAALTRLVDTMDLSFKITEEDAKTEIADSSLTLDDVDFPCLVEIDGEPVDEDDDDE